MHFSAHAYSMATTRERKEFELVAPVADDGTICGYGRYATKCADPTPGQVFIKNAVEGASPKGIAPPEKIVFTPLVETLSKKFAGAK